MRGCPFKSEAGREPTVAELLSDPIAVLLMAHDGITAKEVLDTLKAANNRRRTDGPHRARKAA